MWFPKMTNMGLPKISVLVVFLIFCLYTHTFLLLLISPVLLFLLFVLYLFYLFSPGDPIGSSKTYLLVLLDFLGGNLDGS